MTKETIEGLPEVLQGMLSVLKRRSHDESRNVYMTESGLQVINFDRFSKYYCRKTGVRRLPSTNDALYKTDAGKWIFIEFKNGTVQKEELYRKIYDSLIMLVETGMISDFSYAREQISYILVYNKENALLDKGKTEPPSVTAIHRHMAHKADKIPCLFGLERFSGYLLEDVHTYTQEEFEEHFVAKYEKIEGIS